MNLLSILEGAQDFKDEKETYINEYAGHAFEHEMNEIDLVVSIMDTGVESDVFSRIELLMIEAAYENENGILDFSDFTGFGLEATSEKVNSSVEKIKKFAKKVLSILKGLMRKALRGLNLVINFIVKILSIIVVGATPRKEIILGKKFLDSEMDEKITIHEYSGLDKILQLITNKNLLKNLDQTTAMIDKTVKIKDIQRGIVRLLNNMTYMFEIKPALDEEMTPEKLKSEISGTYKERLNRSIDDIVITTKEVTRRDASGILTRALGRIQNSTKEEIVEIGKKFGFKFKIMERAIEEAIKRVDQMLDSKIKKIDVDSLSNPDDFYKAMDDENTILTFGGGVGINQNKESLAILSDLGILVAQTMAWETKLVTRLTEFVKIYKEDVSKVLGKKDK